MPAISTELLRMAEKVLQKHRKTNIGVAGQGRGRGAGQGSRGRAGVAGHWWTRAPVAEQAVKMHKRRYK